MAKVNRWGKAHVIGVLFEGEPKHANRFVLKDPQRFDDLFHEPIHLAGIDVLNFLEQLELVANLLGNLDEGAQVLWKTTAAEAQSRIEKFATDAGVHAHAIGDLLHIGAG